ncbi:hypothetical protein [Aromatoleum diolicum]|uniref:Uncharacterized protein n=1 Tax=Aromatoleum diolicum TaxID=75796 RepID=A0ABX1QFV9_9RHOO|nr:hypothetical protein [Aromatoleum diolicum]NMG77193.1 hypothetical protein [Aromatoleum diolicum]
MDTKTDLLLYLVYGADSYHQEAVFSIVSAVARLRESADTAVRIEVFADRREPYAALPVRVHALDGITLSRWRAPHGYHFRTKHAALHAVLTDGAEPAQRAILIDTDTFFHTSPSALFERIAPGTLLCNRIGGRYADMREATLYRTLAPRLQSQRLADDDMPLLNSGVIGLCRGDAPLLQRSLALMDELFPHAEGAYTLEEFVLATAARERAFCLSECPTLIHHYWSRKQLFRAKIQAWLRKHGQAPLTACALADVAAVSDTLPRPPAPQRLIHKLVTRLLPAGQRQFSRELLYGCYPHANEFDRACGPVWWDKALANLRERHDVSNSEIERWLDGFTLRRLLGEHTAAIRRHLKHQKAN